MDAASNEEILSKIEADAVISLPTNGGINIRANVSPSVTSTTLVQFDLDNFSHVRSERVAPYALFGDQGGNYFAGSLTEGLHTQTATHSPSGDSLTISFTVVYV